ncbi:MAG: ferrous iron transport protein A [Oscillospiraceae bacterium]|nr:ferrous iron transport protein A [Oscillospiraceae bacterium]
MNLRELKSGERARIISVDCGSGEKNKLLNLGITVGTLIESLYKSPSGNPAAYLVRGAVFALRNETAEKIIILRPQ